MPAVAAPPFWTVLWSSAQYSRISQNVLALQCRNEETHLGVDTDVPIPLLTLNTRMARARRQYNHVSHPKIDEVIALIAVLGSIVSSSADAEE